MIERRLNRLSLARAVKRVCVVNEPQGWERKRRFQNGRESWIMVVLVILVVVFLVVVCVTLEGAWMCLKKVGCRR